MSKVLIFEPALSGHRAHYAAVQARGLLDLGAQVCLAIPENALEHPEGKAFLGEILQEVEHIPLSNRSSGLSVLNDAKSKFGQLRESVSSSRPDHCFVPYADGVSQAWGLRARPNSIFPPELPIEGLMMRGRFAYPASSWKGSITARVSLALQQRAPWTRLHQLDPLAFFKIKNLKSRAQHCLVPEIIEEFADIDTTTAKKRLGFEPRKRLVACPGAVNQSKGSDRLIDALLGIDESENIQLVLFGKHSESVKSKLKTIGPDSRIVSEDRFATTEEFSLLFSAADVIAVCYPRHIGSASILLRAAAAGKRIVASDWGWIGWATRTFQLGDTCDASSALSIRNSIRQNVDLDQRLAAHGGRESARRLLSYHSLENHLAHWTSLYRSRNGLEPAKTLAFDDVIADYDIDHSFVAK